MQAPTHRPPIALSAVSVPGAELEAARIESRQGAEAILEGLRRWAGSGARSLGRSLQGLLLLLLVVDLVALPLHASLHGPGESRSGGHGWHVGQDRLHIEPDSSRANAELLDHSALRPTGSIRPATTSSADGPWSGSDDPATPAAAAAAWLAPLGGLGLLVLVVRPDGSGHIRRRRAAGTGRARPWRGWCPPRQAPPLA